MGWGDALKGVLGELAGNISNDMVADLIKTALGPDGLKTILSKLEAAGLGNIVSSWLNEGVQSLPISPDQLKSALGEQHVQEIAKSLGIPLDAILDGLSKHLPQVAAASLGDASGSSGSSLA